MLRLQYALFMGILASTMCIGSAMGAQQRHPSHDGSEADVESVRLIVYHTAAREVPIRPRRQGCFDRCVSRFGYANVMCVTAVSGFSGGCAAGLAWLQYHHHHVP